MNKFPDTIAIEIKENIVSIRFPISIYINRSIAASLVEHLQAYRIYQDKSFIIYLDNIQYITKDGMQAFSGKDLLCVHYVALIVKSTVGKMISAIFLTFNAPVYPINVFTSEKEAQKAVNMHEKQANFQREYLEGYLAARAGKRLEDSPYLSVPINQLKKFDNWNKGHKDFVKGLRLDFDNDIINIEVP